MDLVQLVNRRRGLVLHKEETSVVVAIKKVDHVLVCKKARGLQLQYKYGTGEGIYIQTMYILYGNVYGIERAFDSLKNK
jgi:hypothetical protein